MTSDNDPTFLSHSELVSLVQQLRQQVTKRDQEIGRLKAQLMQHQTSAPAHEHGQQPPPATTDDPPFGSQEDLLAQLEKMYPT
jgi:hypothetical protein